LDKRGLENI